MSVLINLALILVIGFVVLFVLPLMPRWVQVGSWAALCILNIFEGDAFFSAAYAALAVWTHYEEA